MFSWNEWLILDVNKVIETASTYKSVRLISYFNCVITCHDIFTGFWTPYC